MTGREPCIESCRPSGVILTCYLNGRKLFRAVRLEAPARAPASPPGQGAVARRRNG